MRGPRWLRSGFPHQSIAGVVLTYQKISDNTTKIKQNKVLPYLVSSVVEVSVS